MGLPCNMPASTAVYMFSNSGSLSSEMAEAVGAPLLHSKEVGASRRRLVGDPS